MNLHKNETGNMAMIVITVVAGLIIGFAFGRILGNTVKTTTSSPGISASAEKLSNNLVTLGVQHMQLTDQAVDAALDGNPDATALATKLFDNGNTIGADVGSIYGTSAQSTFDSVWKLHLTQFVNYAVADKEGNTAAKAAALNAIQTGYTVPLAQYLAKVNPYLPEKALQNDLSEHVAMTATMIDDHVQGNYSGEASALTLGDTQIEGIFSTLAGAIVKQYPSKFAD